MTSAHSPGQKCSDCDGVVPKIRGTFKGGYGGYIGFGVSELRGTILGVLTTRVIACWGLYWGPPLWGNYHI